MPDQVLDQSGATTETPSEPTLAEHRAEREAGKPRGEDRKPYAHADSPFKPTQPEEPKPRGGFQRRIDQLTKEKAELQRQLEARQQTGETTGQPTAQTEQAQPGTPRSGRESLSDLAARLERETTAQPTKSGEPNQPQAQELQELQRQHVAKAAILRDRWEASKKADPELAAAVKSSTVLVPQSLHYAITDVPNGHEVAIYLAKHPEVQQRITATWEAVKNATLGVSNNPKAALHAADLTVIREVHRIGTALEFGSISPTRHEITKPVSQAPTPITPVGGGGGSNVEKDEDDMNLNEYRTARERSRNPRRG